MGGTDLAWYRSYRAQLELESGRYPEAIEAYRSAVRMAPRYHPPRAGLGRALAAEGLTGEAIRQYRIATNLHPDPTYIAALGDLYGVSGRGAEARRQLETVEAIATLSGVNEQIYNRPLVLFLADHGLDPERAVRLAETELQVREDVYGWDAYAWALYGAGRFPEAREAADRALELGTRDARLLYHAGMIAAALGDEETARGDLSAALEISPSFDPVHAPIARRTLEGLS
jgi:tetratricopeptide (TPR) repeat protein